MLVVFIRSFDDHHLDDDEDEERFDMIPENENSEENLVNQFDGLGEAFDTSIEHSPIVVNMGMEYSKANVINSMINCNTKISIDRCSRVRSLNDSNFELNETIIQSYTNDENIITTDILVTVLKNKNNYLSLFLITIDKFTLHGQVVYEINPDMLDNSKIEATLLSLDKCTLDEKSLKWHGSYVKSSKLILNGMYCNSIKIKYESVSSFDENGIYSENKLALIPIENLLQIKEYFSLLIKEKNSTNEIPVVSYTVPSNLEFYLKFDCDKNISVDDKFVCPHCKPKEYKCEKNKLRHHIAKHILVYKDIKLHANLCGYCGRIGCSIGLKVTSGKGKNSNYGPDSGCLYRKSFSLGCGSSKNSPSTNRPIECPHCKIVVWSYNLVCHYSDHHSTSVAPEIDIEELIRIQNFK